MLDKETVLDALKRVYDPEIPVDVVNLGLVYEVVVDGGRIDVTMTTTAAGCPVGNYIATQAEQAIRKIAGVTDVHVEMVHEPAWHEKMISPEGRRMLGWRT